MAERDDHALPAGVLEQAIAWFTRLQDGAADSLTLAACQQWRAADPAHELAWQRLHGLCAEVQRGKTGMSAPAARQVLGRGVVVKQRRKAVKRLFGAVALMGVGATAVREWQDEGAAWLAEHRTGVGERREFALADGSRLWLNTDSAVDVSFNALQRRLWLRRGELQLQTAPDEQGRPWTLYAGALEAVPLGTRFVVRRFDTDRGRVAVRQGSVVVRHQALPTRRIVPAGMQIEGSSQGWTLTRQMEDSSDAWTTGMLVVERMPLAAFLEELARYRSGWVSCDPAVAAWPVSGAFPLADTEAVLRSLTEALPLRVRRTSGYWIRVGPSTIDS